MNPSKRSSNPESHLRVEPFRVNSILIPYTVAYAVFLGLCIAGPVLWLGYSWTLACIQALLSLPLFILLMTRTMSHAHKNLAHLEHLLNDHQETRKQYHAVMEEIKYHERLREATFNTSNMILDSKSDQIFVRTLEQAMAIIHGANGGTIALVNADGLMDFVAAKNREMSKLSSIHMPLSETFLYKISKGHPSVPIILHNVDRYDRENLPADLYHQLHGADAPLLASSLCAPLYKGDLLIGMITLDSSTPDAFNEEDKKVLGYFASIVGIALKYRELMDETVYLSQHDKLTGIYNRHHFEEVFNRYQERAYRQNIKFSLVIMDLNYLKSINDSFGHIYGDAALCKFTELVKSHIGPHDLFARIGGDEFIILFNEVSHERASEKMSEIFEAFSDAHVEYMNQSIPIQFSYGVAHCPEESMILDILVKIADSRMYQHKKQLKEKNHHDGRFHIFNSAHNFSDTPTF